jgi:hypothetical protein
MHGRAYTWSKGKAIYAAGVQFPRVHYNGPLYFAGCGNQPRECLAATLLSLVDTVVGIAVGGSCKWIGSYIFYHTVEEPVR